MSFEDITSMIKGLWPLITFLGTIVGVALLGVLKTKFATKVEVIEIKEKISNIEVVTESNGKEIIKIKKDIEHLPTKEQFSHLQEKIGRLEEQSKSTGSMVKTIHDALIGNREGK